MKTAYSPRAALALLLALVAASCSKPQEAAPQPANKQELKTVVRVGYQKIGSPFLLKARADSLNKALAASGASVEWIEFQAGPPILEAMRGGAVDIGYTGETPPVFAQAGDVPFVYVATDPPSPKSEAILVKQDAKLSKLSDLKGKKIALNRGSNVHYLLLRALDKAQLSLADVQVTYLAPADARQAFTSGQVDAWVIWDPFQAAAEIAGARVLADGEGLVDNRFFYLARREFAEQQPELVRTVLKEFATLSEWAGTHVEDASQLLATSSGVAIEALRSAEKRHAYGLQPITPEVIAAQQRIADAFVAQQLIPKPVKIADAASVALYGAAR
jgi:sulfonate transport system substrate-binding protein